MATPTLPYPNMDFTPLDVLTAAEMDQMVANDQYLRNFCAGLANGTNIDNGVILPRHILDGSIQSSKILDGSIQSSKVNWATLKKHSGLDTTQITSITNITSTTTRTFTTDGWLCGKAISSNTDGGAYITIGNAQVAGLTYVASSSMIQVAFCIPVLTNQEVKFNCSNGGQFQNLIFVSVKYV